VINLTRSVALELGERGVRVNCICPGGIATPVFGKEFGLRPEEADMTVAAVADLLATLQPIPRTGLPEEIAAAAIWLASDEAGFVTGHALVVDGGNSAGLHWSRVRTRRAEMAAALGCLRLSPGHLPDAPWCVGSRQHCERKVI
jgi:Enoyl-(Acyl carrier protein) reductase